MIEPYAKHIQGDLRWSDAHFGYRIGHAEGRSVLRPARQRSRHAQVPGHRSGVYLGRRPPAAYALARTVIYELHVRGYTMRHPDVPPQLRGTYAALATAPVIDHLLRLGVTAVELMPVHTFVDDRHLLDRGLRNLLGLQHHRLLRAAHALLGDAAASANSRRW